MGSTYSNGAIVKAVGTYFRMCTSNILQVASWLVISFVLKTRVKMLAKNALDVVQYSSASFRTSLRDGCSYMNPVVKMARIPNFFPYPIWSLQIIGSGIHKIRTSRMTFREPCMTAQVV